MTAYLATDKAEAPRPKAEKVAAARALPQPSQAPVDLPEGTRVTRIRAKGAIRLKKVAYMVDGSRHGQEVLVVIDADRIIVADLAGEILIEHTGSSTSATAGHEAGVPAPDRHRRPDTPTVTEVLMHNCHRSPETSHFGLPACQDRTAPSLSQTSSVGTAPMTCRTADRRSAESPGSARPDWTFAVAKPPRRDSATFCRTDHHKMNQYLFE